MSIIYLAHTVLILSRKNFFCYNILFPSELTDLYIFWFTLTSCSYLQRALLSRNAITLLSHLYPPPSIFSTILKTYSHTITTPISQSQCRSINPDLILLRLSALTTMSRGIKPTQQSTESWIVNILTFIILALGLTSDTYTVQNNNFFNQDPNVHTALIRGTVLHIQNTGQFEGWFELIRPEG